MSVSEPMGAVRVGFLGAGHIATYHSKSIRRVAGELDFEVIRAGVFDTDRDRSEAFGRASGHAPMESIDEVLHSCDAVYVCTWTSEHRRLVEAAVKAGRAVFCEKPLSTSLSDATAIAELLRNTNTINQVGLVLRHSPAYLKARELIADPRAGRVMSVVFRDDQFIPTQGHYASTWRGDVNKAGAGTLLEHSIHDIDMLRALVGPIAAVSARRSNFHGHPGIEDVVAATFSFAGDDGSPTAHGVLTSVWHDNLARPSLRRVEVLCERRFVTIEGDDWFGPVTWVDSDGTSGSVHGDELVRATVNLAPGHSNPDAAFLRAVHRGVHAYPDASVALEAHRVVDAMYRSAGRDGANVPVDHLGVGASTFDVRVVGVDDVRPLRLDVLRRGMTNRTVDFDGDDDASTVHLAAFDDSGGIIGVSTWMRRRCVDRPDLAAVQLRGMATARHLQGSGVGAALVKAGLDRAREGGADVVWANARDAALAFYARHGFEVVGDGFIESVTNLPHHRVLRLLA
jgi:predicted dehydrogenase/predicted GNAT family N-acyltransferase